MFIQNKWQDQVINKVYPIKIMCLTYQSVPKKYLYIQFFLVKCNFLFKQVFWLFEIMTTWSTGNSIHVTGGRFNCITILYKEMFTVALTGSERLSCSKYICVGFFCTWFPAQSTEQTSPTSSVTSWLAERGPRTIKYIKWGTKTT